MNEFPRCPFQDPHLTLWDSMWRSTTHDIVHRSRPHKLTSRQRSEWMIRQLHENCKVFVGKPDFWRYFDRNCLNPPWDPLPNCITGELILFSLFANHNADTLVHWIHDIVAPDDDFPVGFLDPNGHLKHDGTLRRRSRRALRRHGWQIDEGENHALHIHR